MEVTSERKIKIILSEDEASRLKVILLDSSSRKEKDDEFIIPLCNDLNRELGEE